MDSSILHKCQEYDLNQLEHDIMTEYCLSQWKINNYHADIEIPKNITLGHSTQTHFMTKYVPLYTVRPP